MRGFISILPMFMAMAFASTLPSDLEQRQANCGTYTMNMTGGFKTRQVIDFSNARAGQNTQQFLTSNGIYTANWDVNEPEFVSRTFTPDNVQLVDGALAMKVTAYSGTGKIMSSEIGTTSQFKYASVRTVQKSSRVPGICEGNFFYLHEVAEIDFEILTSYIDTTTSCIPKAGIWATTHPPKGSGLTAKSEIFSFPGFDPRDDFHEYRVDWAPNLINYYIDGTYQGSITENVPEVAGSWLWNAWSNGNICWSAGPPTANSDTLIRSITIFKDYVPTAAGTQCPAN